MFYTYPITAAVSAKVQLYSRLWIVLLFFQSYICKVEASDQNIIHSR